MILLVEHPPKACNESPHLHLQLGFYQQPRFPLVFPPLLHLYPLIAAVAYTDALEYIFLHTITKACLSPLF